MPRIALPLAALPLAALPLAALPLAALALAACSTPPTPDAGDASPADAADAITSPPDVPQIPRCGPDAVPFPDDAGMCSAMAPMPDGGLPAPGRCTVTVNAPTGTLKANEMDGDALVLPSGRRVVRAHERLALSGFPMSVLRIPGTSFLAVSDGGLREERLRIVDTSRTPMAVVTGGEVSYPSSGQATDAGLFYGLAYDAANHRLYAAGGGADRIYAYTVSSAGALAADMAHTINLGLTETSRFGFDMAGHLQAGYVAGVALSDDGAHLYAALQRGMALAIFNTATGTLEHTVPMPTAMDAAGQALLPYPYAVARRPSDSTHVYVSLWGLRQVAEVDVGAAMVTRTFDVGKNPEEMVFSPDGATLFVTASDSDSVSAVDLSMPSAPVHTSYLQGSTASSRGVSPSALAYGAGNKLYVVEADENAVEVLDATNPASLASLGRIPTEWYPTDVQVEDDGTLFVATGKGMGSGANNAPDVHDIDDLLGGSLARYAAPSAADLTSGAMTVRYNNTVPSTFNDVTCPAGAAYDFPVPRPGSTTPSAQIRHVILIVRENKTYDDELGDWAGSPGNPADGDPSLTIFPAAQMADAMPNLRAIAERFANHDNYYSNAEQSLQGHVLTSHGRTTDFTERSWLTEWGRGSRVLPEQGVSAIGQPEEGSIFAAMQRAGVMAESWGEAVGQPSSTQFVGTRYPGAIINNGIPDIHKAQAFVDHVVGTNVAGTNASRMCGLASFTYILVPNDHTVGSAAGQPTPLSMVQDNDEATGLIVDAVTHSRFWPETLIAIVEDDPQQGGDHVDNHRSIAMLISPWVRRGYTSHVHYDESSLHHTIELILGVPPHNAVVANAAPMYDAFSTTPDYATFSYVPRRACQELNPMRGRWVDEAAGMDLTHIDAEPGMSRLVWRMTHDGQEPPWRARSEPAADDDDGDGDGR